MCKSCWTPSLRRREELSRRVAELKQQLRSSIDPVAERELLQEIERSDRCDLCRAAVPHSPEASFEAVRWQAEAGRSWPMYMLGNKHQTGAGVAIDHRLAFEWFQALGSMYLAGVGVRPDPKQALRWLLPAVEAGHATAMHNLEQMTPRAWACVGMPRRRRSGGCVAPRLARTSVSRTLGIAMRRATT
jgi:hypothetical protein